MHVAVYCFAINVPFHCCQYANFRVNTQPILQSSVSADSLVQTNVKVRHHGLNESDGGRGQAGGIFDFVVQF